MKKIIIIVSILALMAIIAVAASYLIKKNYETDDKIEPSAVTFADYQADIKGESSVLAL
ncbi:MAG: hypothetical protein LBQ27_05225 [Clostridiales bacterium]|nr:hypothetical protein [Clostridiales bacterium]